MATGVPSDDLSLRSIGSGKRRESIDMINGPAPVFRLHCGPSVTGTASTGQEIAWWGTSLVLRRAFVRLQPDDGPHGYGRLPDPNAVWRRDDRSRDRDPAGWTAQFPLRVRRSVHPRRRRCPWMGGDCGEQAPDVRVGVLHAGDPPPVPEELHERDRDQVVRGVPVAAPQVRRAAQRIEPARHVLPVAPDLGCRHPDPLRFSAICPGNGARPGPGCLDG